MIARTNQGALSVCVPGWSIVCGSVVMNEKRWGREAAAARCGVPLALNHTPPLNSRRQRCTRYNSSIRPT
jgi:hypothetical protein